MTFGSCGASAQLPVIGFPIKSGPEQMRRDKSERLAAPHNFLPGSAGIHNVPLNYGSVPPQFYGLPASTAAASLQEQMQVLPQRRRTAPRSVCHRRCRRHANRSINMGTLDVDVRIGTTLPRWEKWEESFLQSFIDSIFNQSTADRVNNISLMPRIRQP